MMKLLTSFIIAVSCSFLYAQDGLSFNSKFGKIEFTVLSNEIYVEYNPRDTLKISQIMTDSSFYIGPNSAIIHQEGLVRNFDSKKRQFIQENDINFLRIEPVLLFSDGTKQIAKGEINLRIKNGYHIEDVIDNYDYNFKIKLLLETNNLYTISSDTLETRELFDIIDQLNTDSRIEFAEPNFIRLAKLSTSDPYFNSQWAINNQGVNGWTQGADMNVESAWNYSTGKNVKVAIIDVGVQLDHPDLQANLLPGFDAVGWGSNGGPAYIGLPNQVPPVEPPHDNYHGTACAGIVAAVANNNLGIAGVAYDAKIIPIRIGYKEDPLNNTPLITDDSWLASGINWAWRHGADILSNSWGGGSYSDLIAEAVDSAVIRGRNGKGAIVLFSTGNESSDVAFPAYLEKVIAVGASSPCDEPKTSWSCDGENWWGENFGEDLDIIAPGVKIYTTDLTGSAGKTPNSFMPDFNGTSASCPNAAAVCALILSIDTNMTGIQVRNILETTCDKVGGLNYTNVAGQPNGTWNEQAGYGRINACRAVLIAKQGGNILTNTNFTTNTLLSMDAYANGDIVVEPNVTLTITGKIQMGDNMKVIIKQGAKLIIDGGTLTNAGDCGDFWQGIQVYGTTNKNQYPENNPTYQGLLVIKNGGIIENAHKAVTNWHQDSWNEIGGVIQATDAVFRNNRRDVEFISYQNYTPSYTNKYRNLSRFTNTDFVTDDGFIENGLPIQTHVTMWQVDGITFTNCHFSNDITVNKNNSSSPNRGIYSIDAGYTVGAGCSSLFYPCPTSNLLKSSFNGLGTAIEATGAGTTETVTIQQTDFTNNVWGITISDFDNVSVNRNNINIGDAGYTLFWPLGAGILLENSTGYIVEENKISTNLPQDYRVAINVNNSGTDDNRIYKNDLSNLQVGTQTTGVNYNNINPFLGLQFLCNKYSNNSKGINVTSSSTNDGVRTTQGTINLSSGNTFMNNTLDFNNDANIVFYYHNYGNTQPTYLGNVLPLVSNSTNTCPTSFGGGGVVMKPFLLALDSLNTELDGLTTSYNNLNFTYTSLIDDGNTDQFKDNIELNWSNDAWLLRSELLASSPYLSSEVLLEVAKQNVLPNGMLLEILLANPDATRGERFINELKEVTNNSFPDYMLGYVRGNYNSRTLRTDMEGQLSAIHSELSNTRSWIKHLTKSKEEYANSDRFDVVNLGDEIYNKVGVMDYYISNGDFNKADSVLSIIHNDKRYKTDLTLIENFGDYINFRENLGNRNLAQLDSTEIAYLQTLANNKGRVAGYAQNILCFFYDICYEKELPYGNPQNKAMMIPSKNNQEELNNILYNIKIYPNPAKDYASISWEIYDELNNLRYNVVDLNGREQLNGVLSNNKGEQVLDTRKLRNGVYIIGIYNNNQLKVSKKLVVENQK